MAGDEGSPTAPGEPPSPPLDRVAAMGALERLMEWIGRRDRTLAGSGHPPGDTSPEPAVAEVEERIEHGEERDDEPPLVGG
jgi:predicted TIM-barrel fold metal-dependent hydrolase